MIRLKNGKVVEYDENFDLFFKNLLDSIIAESRKSMKTHGAGETGTETKNEILLKEIMDNCIYVTQQLFDIAKTNENLSKFMVTGFIFNSIIYTITYAGSKDTPKVQKKGEVIH